MWNFFGVAVFHASMVNWRGYICPKYMCILLYVKLLWCSGIPYIYGQLELEVHVGICAFYYMLNLFNQVVFHKIYGQFEEEGLGICAFCYMWNFFGVAVFHTSMVNWRRGGTSKDPICKHICAFCYMLNIFSVVVFHTSLSSIGGGGTYKWILLYVKLLWCSTIPYIYASRRVHLP